MDGATGGMWEKLYEKGAEKGGMGNGAGEMPGGWAAVEIGVLTAKEGDMRLADGCSSTGEDMKGPSVPSVSVVTVRSRGGALLRPLRFLFCLVAICGSTKYLAAHLASDKMAEGPLAPS